MQQIFCKCLTNYKYFKLQQFYHQESLFFLAKVVKWDFAMNITIYIIIRLYDDDALRIHE